MREKDGGAKSFRNQKAGQKRKKRPLNHSSALRRGGLLLRLVPAGKLVTLVHMVMAACPGTPAGLLRTWHERAEEPSPTPVSAETASAATSKGRRSSFIDSFLL